MQKRRPLTPNGIKVRTELAKRNMTQRELAEKIEVSETGLGEFMRGTRSGTTFIKRIEQTLNIHLIEDK